MLVLATVLLAMAGSVSAQETEPSNIVAEIVVEDLAAPTDFSVTADGEVVFIAEQGAQQIRRLQGDVDEVVVSGIESDDQSAESIAVIAINAHRVLVGLSGFSSSQHALCLFDTSAKELPLGFADQQVERSRSYERSLERIKTFNVLRLIREQRGLIMVCKFGESSPTVCDIHFKGGNLERLVEHNFEANIGDLSTLAVDQMGGYLVAVTQDKPKQVVFYRVERTLTQSFLIDLENIVSLSFSPVHNRLFAIVNSADDDAASGDGIYEILTDGDACRSRFVIELENPQKLKFDAQGNGWVLSQSATDRSLGLLNKINNLDVSPTIAETKEQGTNEN